MSPFDRQANPPPAPGPRTVVSWFHHTWEAEEARLLDRPGRVRRLHPLWRLRCLQLRVLIEAPNLAAPGLSLLPNEVLDALHGAGLLPAQWLPLVEPTTTGMS